MKSKPFEAARSLTDEEAIRRYLAQPFEAGDLAACQLVLGDVARALGVKDIARSAGMTRKVLERVRHLRPDLVSWLNGKTQTLPD